MTRTTSDWATVPYIDAHAAMVGEPTSTRANATGAELHAIIAFQRRYAELPPDDLTCVERPKGTGGFTRLRIVRAWHESDRRAPTTRSR